MPLDTAKELDRVRALREVYEQAIAAIQLKIDNALTRQKRLELVKLKAQHEISLASLDRQITALQTYRRSEPGSFGRAISDFERNKALDDDAIRRALHHECPYCGKLTASIQGCRDCLSLIAQENQNAT
jgi:hypothetical protein